MGKSWIAVVIGGILAAVLRVMASGKSDDK